jgi:hypothetical protein
MDGQDMAQAIDKISALATAAQKTTTLAVNQEPAGYYYLIGPDGKATLTEAKPGWHAEKLATPAQLRDFIKGTTMGEGALFYDEQRVTYVYSLDDRRDRATCDLKKSPQYLWLETAAAKPVVLSQRDFIRTLRVLFRGCVGESNLLPLVRDLKFTGASEGAGNIQHGRESIGRSITNAVTGQSAIPEEVALTVPVFENHPLRARISCALEVVPQDQTFQLIPYPLEVHQAMDAALADVVATLKADGVPTSYNGSPV